MKPKWVDNFTKVSWGAIGEILRVKDEIGKLGSIIQQLDLQNLLKRKLNQISEGEL